MQAIRSTGYSTDKHKRNLLTLKTLLQGHNALFTQPGNKETRKVKYRISRPIRRTVIFSLKILEKNSDECILILVIYWKKTGLLQTKISNHKQWCQISWFESKFHYLTIKMLYNRCTGIYKFGNYTYPRHIRRKSNLGHIFQEKECVLWARKYGNY